MTGAGAKQGECHRPDIKGSCSDSIAAQSVVNEDLERIPRRIEEYNTHNGNSYWIEGGESELHARLKKELHIAHVLADAGHRVVLHKPIISRKVKNYDALIDGLPFEFKQSEKLTYTSIDRCFIEGIKQAPRIILSFGYRMDATEMKYVSELIWRRVNSIANDKKLLQKGRILSTIWIISPEDKIFKYEN